MARKKRRYVKRAQKEASQLYKVILSVVALAGAVFLVLAWIGKAGIAGDISFKLLHTLFGAGFILVPTALLITGLLLVTSWRAELPLMSVFGGVLMFFSVFGMLDIPFRSHSLFGLIGKFSSYPFIMLFDTIGGFIIMLALSVIGAVLLFRVNPSAIMENISMPELPTFGKKEEEEDYDAEVYGDEEEDYEEEDEEEEEPEEEKHEPKTRLFTDNAEEAEDEESLEIRDFGEEYNKPPLSLLSKDKGKPGVGDVKANANIIKRTFQNFGIETEMDEISIGPSVTRYALKPAEGVRLSKIVALQNNLELALAAHPVRIEAPIPGRSLVGIEVPNTSKITVGLAGLISSPQAKKNPAPLLASIGRDISGTPHFVDVARMPHGLIAGATGSGKSVAVHAIITSLLYRNGPDALRFIMVDPKRVELTLYNNIPHLLTPVITEPKKTVLALKWATKEMERRYSVLEEHSVRDIASYHDTILPKNEEAEKMPYIVIVIDELADVMQSYPREMEANIVRLAQMSRAVGIHLVLSTQRPSVNVVTGLIKANVPSRMALQVASQVDSKTILDSAGAEKLLGAGDMLYLSGDRAKPVRIQTAFVSEGEVKKVVSYIKKNNSGDLSSLDFSGNSEGNMEQDVFAAAGIDEDVDDDMYEEAYQTVVSAGKASTSYLQRRLRIGYSRAARLMDILEDKGIIGPQDGSKPREVLIGKGSGDNEDVEDEEEQDDDDQL